MHSRTQTVTQMLLENSLLILEGSVIDLSKRVPAPKPVPFNGSYVYRHVEQWPEQAIVQKMAKLPSTLRGAQALLELGLFQEQAALQRIIDEIQEDIVFISQGVLNDDLTELHKEYLHAFFLEEQDAVTGDATDIERPMVRRKKIRAYNARSFASSSDPSGHIKVSRDISKLYSGFVHAASPHIMDMYLGEPPKFHMRGMLGTEREPTFRRDIYNYFYRSVTSGAFGAYALRALDVGNALHRQAQELEIFMYGQTTAP